MLWQRVVTALVLIPLVLWLVLFADAQVFSIGMMVVISLAAIEWAMLSGLSGILRYIFALVIFSSMYGLSLFADDINYLIPLSVISLIWLFLTVSLILQKKPVERLLHVSYVSLLSGAVMLIVAWLSISKIHGLLHHGPLLVMAMLVMIWIADTAAYFSGRFFGRHKLSPQVSPGKTWEGVAGALLGVAVFGYLLTAHPFFQQVNPFYLALMSVIVAFVSIGGDLFESKIKRQRGVKDSGNILPGHGGIYDRIDSLIAAAPVFLLGIGLLTGEIIW